MAAGHVAGVKARLAERDGGLAADVEAVDAIGDDWLLLGEFAEVQAVTPEEVRAMVDAGEDVQVIDARPRHYTTKSHEIMEGAVWRDPERLDDWIGELSKEKPVVTYCVYGFHIGCQTAIALKKAGFDARYMAGGHSAWKAIDGKVRHFDGNAPRNGEPPDQRQA